MRHPLLALADVHRLTTVTRGRTIDVYVFDHHRTAFTIWTHAAQALGAPLTLVTLDRHMDLGTPAAVAPRFTEPLRQLDAFARHELAPSNDDHIVAATESGAIADAVVVARSHEPASLARFRPLLDRTGTLHRFAFAPGPARLGADAHVLVREAGHIALDIDLDAFTTPSDGDPEELLAWDRAAITRWLQPPGSGSWWDELLARTAVVTIAREPYHCGGFARGAQLWRDFSAAFFVDLLRADEP